MEKPKSTYCLLIFYQPIEIRRLQRVYDPSHGRPVHVLALSWWSQLMSVYRCHLFCFDSSLGPQKAKLRSHSVVIFVLLNWEYSVLSVDSLFCAASKVYSVHIISSFVLCSVHFFAHRGSFVSMTEKSSLEHNSVELRSEVPQRVIRSTEITKGKNGFSQTLSKGIFSSFKLIVMNSAEQTAAPSTRREYNIALIGKPCILFTVDFVWPFSNNSCWKDRADPADRREAVLRLHQPHGWRVQSEKGTVFRILSLPISPFVVSVTDSLSWSTFTI